MNLHLDLVWEHILTEEGPSSTTPTTRQETPTPDWTVAEAQEFVPQGFDASQLVGRSLLLDKSHSIFGLAFCNLNLLSTSRHHPTCQRFAMISDFIDWENVS